MRTGEDTDENTAWFLDTWVEGNFIVETWSLLLPVGGWKVWEDWITEVTKRFFASFRVISRISRGLSFIQFLLLFSPEFVSIFIFLVRSSIAVQFYTVEIDPQRLFIPHLLQTLRETKRRAIVNKFPTDNLEQMTTAIRTFLPNYAVTQLLENVHRYPRYTFIDASSIFRSSLPLRPVFRSKVKETI